MKLLLLVVLSVCIMTLRAEPGSACDKDTACAICQRTAYEMKFNYRPSCSNSHCKSTCYKVLSQWNQPGSVFEAFLGDNVGKCDVCFRAGYCSSSQCEDQKRREQKIIEQTVDQTNFAGVVDTRSIDEMVHKVLKEEHVDFKKYAKKVKENVKESLEHKKFLKDRKNLSKTLSGVLKTNEKNIKASEKELPKVAHKSHARRHIPSHKELFKKKKKVNASKKKVDSVSIKLHNAGAEKKPIKPGCKEETKQVKKIIKAHENHLTNVNKEIKSLTTQYKRVKDASKRKKIVKAIKETLKKAKTVKKVLKNIKKEAKKNGVHPQSRAIVQKDKKKLDQAIIDVKVIARQIHRAKGNKKKALLKKAVHLVAKTRILAKKIYKKTPKATDAPKPSVAAKNTEIKGNIKRVQKISDQIRKTKSPEKKQELTRKMQVIINKTKKLQHLPNKTPVIAQQAAPVAAKKNEIKDNIQKVQKISDKIRKTKSPEKKQELTKIMETIINKTKKLQNLPSNNTKSEQHKAPVAAKKTEVKANIQKVQKISDQIRKTKSPEKKAELTKKMQKIINKTKKLQHLPITKAPIKAPVAAEKNTIKANIAKVQKISDQIRKAKSPEKKQELTRKMQVIINKTKKLQNIPTKTPTVANTHPVVNAKKSEIKNNIQKVQRISDQIRKTNDPKKKQALTQNMQKLIKKTKEMQHLVVHSAPASDCHTAPVFQRVLKKVDQTHRAANELSKIIKKESKNVNIKERKANKAVKRVTTSAKEVSLKHKVKDNVSRITQRLQVLNTTKNPKIRKSILKAIKKDLNKLGKVRKALRKIQNKVTKAKSSNNKDIVDRVNVVIKKIESKVDKKLAVINTVSTLIPQVKNPHIKRRLDAILKKNQAKIVAGKKIIAKAIADLNKPQEVAHKPAPHIKAHRHVAGTIAKPPHQNSNANTRGIDQDVVDIHKHNDHNTGVHHHPEVHNPAVEALHKKIALKKKTEQIRKTIDQLHQTSSPVLKQALISQLKKETKEAKKLKEKVIENENKCASIPSGATPVVAQNENKPIPQPRPVVPHHATPHTTNNAHPINTTSAEDAARNEKNNRIKSKVAKLRDTLQKVKLATRPEEKKALLNQLKHNVKEVEDAKQNKKEEQHPPKLPPKPHIRKPIHRVHIKKAPIHTLPNQNANINTVAATFPNPPNNQIVPHTETKKQQVQEKVAKLKQTLEHVKHASNPELKKLLLKQLKKEVKEVKDAKHELKHNAPTAPTAPVRIAPIPKPLIKNPIQKTPINKIPVAHTAPVVSKKTELKQKVQEVKATLEKVKATSSSTEKQILLKTLKKEVDQVKELKKEISNEKAHPVNAHADQPIAPAVQLEQKKIEKVLKLPGKTVKKVQKVIHKITDMARATKTSPTPGAKQKLGNVTQRLINYVSVNYGKILNMISHVQTIKKKLELNLNNTSNISVNSNKKIIDDLLRKLMNGRQTLQDSMKTIASFKDNIERY